MTAVGDRQFLHDLDGTLRRFECTSSTGACSIWKPVRHPNITRGRNGPLAYYTGKGELNPPKPKYWAVARGFPRKSNNKITLIEPDGYSVTGIFVTATNIVEVRTAINKLPKRVIEMPCGAQVDPTMISPVFQRVLCPCGNSKHILFEVARKDEQQKLEFIRDDIERKSFAADAIQVSRLFKAGLINYEQLSKIDCLIGIPIRNGKY